VPYSNRSATLSAIRKAGRKARAHTATATPWETTGATPLLATVSTTTYRQPTDAVTSTMTRLRLNHRCAPTAPDRRPAHSRATARTGRDRCAAQKGRTTWGMDGNDVPTPAAVGSMTGSPGSPSHTSTPVTTASAASTTTVPTSTPKSSRAGARSRSLLAARYHRREPTTPSSGKTSPTRSTQRTATGYTRATRTVTTATPAAATPAHRSGRPAARPGGVRAMASA
jgi:hypothetical protein